MMIPLPGISQKKQKHYDHEESCKQCIKQDYSYQQKPETAIKCVKRLWYTLGKANEHKHIQEAMHVMMDGIRDGITRLI